MSKRNKKKHNNSQASNQSHSQMVNATENAEAVKAGQNNEEQEAPALTVAQAAVLSALSGDTAEFEPISDRAVWNDNGEANDGEEAKDSEDAAFENSAEASEENNIDEAKENNSREAEENNAGTADDTNAEVAGEAGNSIEGRKTQVPVRPGKPGVGRPGPGKPGPGKPGPGKPGVGRPGPGKNGPGKPGEGRNANAGKQADKPVVNAEKNAEKPKEKSKEKPAEKQVEKKIIPKDAEEKREIRRKRRVRNQIIAYVVVILLLLVIAGAAYIGIKTILKHTGNKQVTPEDATGNIEVTEPTEQTEEIITDLLVPEEVIKEPVAVDEPVVVPEVIDDPLGDYVDGIIANMTLEEKVAGLFVTTPESITGVNLATVAGDGTKAALEKYAVGGIVYSAKNISTKEQFSTMISKTVEMVGVRPYPTFIAIAEEGGANSPLANAGYYTKTNDASAIAATNDATEAFKAGVEIGVAMNSIGFNLDFAPVADLSSVAGNILGNSSFGSSAVDVSVLVGQMINGIEGSNVNACLKYFPGMGVATANPANGRVVSNHSREEFDKGEFLVYKAAVDNGTKMIMMSNVVYSALDDTCPASLSSAIITDILRGEMGYEGIVISGNLSDAAIKDYYSDDMAAVNALKAGCDMIFCPANFEAAYKGIIDAINSGVISEERVDDALRRIFRVKCADAI